jgi:predicted phage tail protein
MAQRTETLTKFVLSGRLGKEFGREFTLSVSSVREGIRALCIQIPGLEQFLNRSERNGLTYAVFNGARNISTAELQLDGIQMVVRIVPVIIGSKKQGMFQTILGAVMVAAGFVLSLSPATIAASPFLYQAGAAMMLGGVAQMLAPQGTYGMTDTKETRKSYSFGSASNNSAAGRPVPAFYGKTLIGGPVISGETYVEQQQ